MAQTKKYKTKTIRKSQTAHRTISFLLVLLFLLVFASIGTIAYSVYYFNNNPPTTNATGYVDSLSYAPEQTYAIEINYFENIKANGVQALEYRWNYYTDTLIPTTETGIQTAKDNATIGNKLDKNKLFDNLFKVIYSSGMQMIDDIKFNLLRYQQPALIFGDFRYCTQPVNPYYYNTTNDTSYTGINNLDYTDNWIIDFGSGTLGRIVQDKEQVLLNEHPFGNSYYRMDVNKFMRDVFECVKSLKYGKQVLMFDLSDYFVFEFFSTDDLKFHRPETDEQNLYINILVNKSENGMIDKSQSLFKIVKGNPDWNNSGLENSDYWKSHQEITLLESNFVVTDNLLLLKPEALKYLKSFDNIDICIEIDLARVNANGFAKNAFEDLNVIKIYVYSNVYETFTYYFAPCEIETNEKVTLEVIV